MAFNISKCREQIDEACNISLATDAMNDFDKCNDFMIDFRQDSYIKIFLYAFLFMLRVMVNKTKTNYSLVCGNWSHLNSKVPNIKNCNNGTSTNDVKLKIKEKDIKRKLETCKRAVGTCKRYEDQTIPYIVICRTSS